MTYPTYEMHITPQWAVKQKSLATQFYNAEYCKIIDGVLYLYNNEHSIFGSLVGAWAAEHWESIKPVTRGGE